MLSVVHRELCAEARHPFTYWVRVLAMAGLLGVAFWFVATEGLQPGSGGELFVWLHRTLLFLIWFLVPLMTADVISRERREGTLGLLLLTPLSAWDIVVAKSLAHGMRALSFCVAALPVLCLPFLAGGVSWLDAVKSALFNLGSLFCALAAGVLASSWCKAWARAMLWAAMTAGIFFVVFVAGHFVVLMALVWQSEPQFGGQPLVELSTVHQFVIGCAYVINWDEVWRNVAARWLTGPNQGQWLAGVGAGTLISVVLWFGALRLAARNVRRSWREVPASAFQQWVLETLCRPVLLRATLRRWLHWKLERNPVGWLEQRTWSARLSSWSWLAVLIAVYAVTVGDLDFYRFHFRGVQNLLLTGLFLSMAAAAAGSFRRERDNGVLQLLLVSPLQVEQIISGRVRSLWGQFLPATLLLAGVWYYVDKEIVMMRSGWGREPSLNLKILFYASTYLATPLIGLYFSLRERSHLTALLATIITTTVVPAAATVMLYGLAYIVSGGMVLRSFGAFYQIAPAHTGVISMVTIQLITAGLCAGALRARLQRRQFHFAAATN